MSRYRTMQFVVNIEQITVDGCCREITPITEGMVRRALENLEGVHSVYVREMEASKRNEGVWK